MASAIQRIYEVNERMIEHRVEMREPLVINLSEIDEVAEYIFGMLRTTDHYKLEYLKMSVRDGKAKMFGRQLLVLK